MKLLAFFLLLFSSVSICAADVAPPVLFSVGTNHGVLHLAVTQSAVDTDVQFPVGYITGQRNDPRMVRVSDIVNVRLLVTRSGQQYGVDCVGEATGAESGKSNTCLFPGYSWQKGDRINFIFFGLGGSAPFDPASGHFQIFGGHTEMVVGQ